jgi:hypothetical protein
VARPVGEQRERAPLQLVARERDAQLGRLEREHLGERHHAGLTRAARESAAT